MKTNNCVQIASVYKRFLEVENEWRINYNKAKNDKVSRYKALSGIRAVEVVLKELNELPRCSPEKAKEILGKDFLGAEAVEKTFGFAVSLEEIPPIRFSAKELKEAQAHNEQLILRVSHDGEGNPMTMERMLKIMAKRMQKKEKLLFAQNNPGAEELPDDCWFKKEEFFWNDKVKMEWVLVGKDFVLDTTDKNYVEQTLEIYKYLKERKFLSEKEKAEYAGLENKLKQYCEEMGMDWKTLSVLDQPKYEKNWPEVAKKLANLPINQKHRRNSAGILFDWLMNFKAGNGRGKLENLYDWSTTVSSAGDLLNIGYFDSDGAHVSGYDPANSDDGLGVVFVRGSSLHK
jgi:hypothetical protein